MKATGVLLYRCFKAEGLGAELELWRGDQTPHLRLQAPLCQLLAVCLA